MSIQLNALKGKASAIASLGMAIFLIAAFAAVFIGATYSAWVHQSQIEDVFERERFIGGYIVAPWIIGLSIWLLSELLGKRLIPGDEKFAVSTAIFFLIVAGIMFYSNNPFETELGTGMLTGVLFNNFWGQFMGFWVTPKIWKGAMEEFRREFPKK